MNIPRLTPGETPDVKVKIKSQVFSWPPGFTCDECGSRCEADRVYDVHTAAFDGNERGEVPSWYCSDCDKHYYREGDEGYTFDPWGL